MGNTVFPKRLIEIDRAKGIAIILVVLGHIMPDGPPPSERWFSYLHYAIYSFHMPFFMYLSGFVFFLSGSHLRRGSAYSALIRDRTFRLIIPFIAFGVIILLGKYVMQAGGQVTRAPQSLADGVYAMFLATNDSPVRSIWYVFVLFLFSALTPMLWKIAQPRIFALAAIAAVLAPLPVPDVLYLDRAIFFFPFFLLGGGIALHRDRLLPMLDRFAPLAWTIFIVSVAIILSIYHHTGGLDRPVELFGGICAIPALHHLSRTVWAARCPPLVFFGKYAFAIYLINTIALGMGMVALNKLGHHVIIPFVAQVLLLLAIGLFVPILIKVAILDRSRTLAKMTS